MLLTSHMGYVIMKFVTPFNVFPAHSFANHMHCIVIFQGSLEYSVIGRR